ncbi:MAG: hypothetical protein M0R74_15430 [Dehalococcoidia bacterium]|nr:hypothetical protein [Dehalococcoidia bacterium]
MKNEEYETLHKICGEIMEDDTEALIGLEHDCAMLNAKKLARYAKECISGKQYKTWLAQMYLAEDFAGI